MLGRSCWGGTQTVALLAEGVDRNAIYNALRAKNAQVALLAEGVDRNFLIHRSTRLRMGRPPRGGRG